MSVNAVRILYTNHRGEMADRTIDPWSLYFGSTKWHPEPQWLLRALDLDKNVERHYAMKDISSWTSLKSYP
ncbi:MAG: hypothetical protein Q7R39_11035 [Dehalococcoidia bacterium]|nr:hypothetical protein [Dehalococcoidia bacterium]